MKLGFCLFMIRFITVALLVFRFLDILYCIEKVIRVIRFLTFSDCEFRDSLLPEPRQMRTVMSQHEPMTHASANNSGLDYSNQVFFLVPVALFCKERRTKK